MDLEFTVFFTTSPCTFPIWGNPLVEYPEIVQFRDTELGIQFHPEWGRNVEPLWNQLLHLLDLPPGVNRKKISRPSKKAILEAVMMDMDDPQPIWPTIEE